MGEVIKSTVLDESKKLDTAPGVIIFRKRLLAYSETFIADQGQYLSRYRPLFCGFSKDKSGNELVEESPQNLFDENMNFPGIGKLMFRLKIPVNKNWLRKLRRFKPNLIHAHFFNDGLDALLLSRVLELPIMVTLHGHDITKHNNAQSDQRQTHRLFSQADRFIAVSSFIAEQALARGCPEDKLVQHAIGIDLVRFDQKKCEASEPVLLFVGRLVKKKGVTYILQALQRLQPRYPSLRLIIVGDGHLKKTLQEEAKERAVNADFVGSKTSTEIRELMAQAWLFVAPSITSESGDAEGLGMVFLEAQAMHTPVVSFRSGGIPEAVDEDVTALLCDEKDVTSLADNIAILLNDETSRHTMGQSGRVRVETHFDIRKQCLKLEKIYDSICR